MSDPKDSVPAPGDNGEPVSPNSLSLAVLSMYRSSYSVRRILEEGRARGHRIRAFDPTAFSILVEQDQPRLFYRGKPAPQIDGVIPRIGASITHFGTTVVRQFEQMGVFCINTSHAINSSRDKLHAMQVLSRHRIGMPRTAFVTDRLAVKPAIDHVGGAPVVLKLLEATQGIGVILADHAKTAEAIVEAL
ncbi:MAG: 30S ribosomal protein S6--L-glutamate ligase, partial [Myxococcales bacterium]|nr:30S ribosomal protein S6--L-glutamate ligase [Myxococcales bacterium]